MSLLYTVTFPYKLLTKLINRDDHPLFFQSLSFGIAVKEKTPCNLQGAFFRSVILRRVCDIGASESMYFTIVTSEFLTTGPSINLQKLSLPCVFEGECSQKHVFCSSRARVFHYSSVYKFRDLHFTTCF